MGTRRKINAILLNIKINRPKLVNMCRYKLATYILAKFHGNILNLSENIAKSFRGATFLTHTVDTHTLLTLCGTMYSVSQKSRRPPKKLFAIFLFVVNLCNWKFSQFFPEHIYVSTNFGRVIWIFVWIVLFLLVRLLNFNNSIKFITKFRFFPLKKQIASHINKLNITASICYVNCLI